MRRLPLLVGLLLAIAVGGCGSDEGSPTAEPAAVETAFEAETELEAQTDSEETSNCEPATQEIMDAIASGLTVSGGGTLEDGQMVPAEVSNALGGAVEGYYVSAEIHGQGMGDDGQVGTWSYAPPGSIFALNSMAREFSDWGAGAADGSRAAEIRDAMADTEEAEQSRDCVESS